MYRALAKKEKKSGSENARQAGGFVLILDRKPRVSAANSPHIATRRRKYRRYAVHSATLEFIYVPPGVRYPSLLSFPFRALTTPSVKNDAQRLHTRDDEMIEVYACVCDTLFRKFEHITRESWPMQAPEIKVVIFRSRSR